MKQLRFSPALNVGGMVVVLAMLFMAVGCKPQSGSQSAPPSTPPAASPSSPVAPPRAALPAKDFSTAYTATVLFGDPATESGDGLTYLPNASWPASLTELEGVPCRLLKTPPGNTGYFYFALDPTFKKGTMKHFHVTVEFYDSQPGEMTLQFDGSKTWKIPNAAYAQAEHNVNLTGKKRWKTEPFDIYDATFNNSQHAQADFRLRVTASELHIRRVTLERREREHARGPVLAPGPDFSGAKTASLPLGNLDSEAEQGIILNTTERDGRSVVTQLDGIPCRYSAMTNKPWGYLYFAIAESFKWDLKDVDIEVECLAPRRVAINIEFDGSKRRDIPSPAFAKPGPDLWLAGSPQWQTNVFRVRNATFENKQNGQSDFRLTIRPPDLYVRRITLTRPTTPAR